MSDTPIRSYAKANRELINAFERYSIARGMSPNTIRAYVDSATRLADLLGSTSFGEVKRGTIRQLLSDLHRERPRTQFPPAAHGCASFVLQIRETHRLDQS